MEEQYEQMRGISGSNRQSMKRSQGNVKGVPHASITLKPRQSGLLREGSTLSYNSTISRSNSQNEGSSCFRVVSIASVCGQRRAKSRVVVR